MRGATGSLSRTPEAIRRFNPRARAGRDFDRIKEVRIFNQFQSTRPCWARHQQAVEDGFDGTVSIHAPVRGATVYLHSQVFRGSYCDISRTTSYSK